ncbi:MAG: 2-phosphosulfolactate phosphatase [candidate division Zixibacteria bacterium]|nr:2-phosphosulfolactate phosphatase [candidate division Zixibacteria bacterium]MDH3935876.1 2-phosphosulfolactate phosphatase [candidate division Zixibacteria bacterium]MDH4034963.1 2-phosphosulfolactate phosphatase [candidate division Zixibacteria bacterium]
MDVQLYLTPFPSAETEINDKIVVVIDVLRCTTCISAALMVGARGVIPTPGPGEAVDMWTKIGPDMAILAGERQGIKIENFQLGNSPMEFTADAVGGKHVVMTTSNGTAAFLQATSAALTLSCSLTNITRVVDRIAVEERDLVITCAGRGGQFSIEDTICGGMVLHLLSTDKKLKLTINDAGSLALLLYRSNKNALRQTIAQGEHGRYLSQIGFASDVTAAAVTDSMPVLPILREGQLVAADD